MLESLFAPVGRPTAIALAICLAPVLSLAQSSPKPPAKVGEPVTTHVKVGADSKANDAVLTKAAALYFSTAKAGLVGFDCSVHPDWRAVFLAANNSAALADDDPRIVLLKSVDIVLHARMKGGSSLDWNPPAHPEKPLDADSTQLLDTMQGSTSQTLQGFLQFWTPFVDGSAIPPSSDGLEMKQTDDGGYIIHVEQDGLTLTEILSKELVVKHFNVVMDGTKVNFAPAYKETADGLLVNSFEAEISPAGATPDQAQKMHVEVEYKTIDGAPIPASLNIEILGTGRLSFAIDHCTVNRKAN